MEYDPKGVACHNLMRVLSEEKLPREFDEPWIRLVRETFDDNNQVIKYALGIFSYVDGNFEIHWREFKKGAMLTDIAPMDQYLVWVK